MREFTGRQTNDPCYIAVSLVTDMRDYDEPVQPHRQVDVRLPHGKVLRIPFGWLVEEDTGTQQPIKGKLAEETIVVDDLPPARKVAVKRP